MNKILKKIRYRSHTLHKEKLRKGIHRKITQQSTKLLDDNRKTLEDLQ